MSRTLKMEIDEAHYLDLLKELELLRKVANSVDVIYKFWAFPNQSTQEKLNMSIEMAVRTKKAWQEWRGNNE